MSYGEFIYLMGGMLDVLDPSVTESSEECIERKVREMAQKSVKRRSL